MKNHELIEKVGEVEPKFKVGDLVCYTAHSDNCLYKIKENHVSHGFVVGSSGDREFWTMFVGEIRHACPSEIAAGHRELLGNSEQLDDVADIKYHVSPLTKVSCHHQWINQDYLGCTEHHYFCAYCSENKTEAFGSCDHDWEDVTKSEQTERFLVCTYCDETKIQDMAIDAERWGES